MAFPVLSKSSWPVHEYLVLDAGCLFIEVFQLYLSSAWFSPVIEIKKGEIFPEVETFSSNASDHCQQNLNKLHFESNLLSANFEFRIGARAIFLFVPW